MRRCMLRSPELPAVPSVLTFQARRWISSSFWEWHPALVHVGVLEDAGVTLGRSKTIESNGSIFEAFAAVGITDKSQAQELCKLAREAATPDATHPAMLGFVLPGGETGHDDDGEKGAGRRIVEAATNAAGSPPHRNGGVAICVTRYYGGIQLGKQRWVMIRAAADDAAAAAIAARRTE